MEIFYEVKEQVTVQWHRIYEGYFPSDERIDWNEWLLLKTVILNSIIVH